MLARPRDFTPRLVLRVSEKPAEYYKTRSALINMQTLNTIQYTDVILYTQ